MLDYRGCQLQGLVKGEIFVLSISDVILKTAGPLMGRC